MDYLQKQLFYIIEKILEQLWEFIQMDNLGKFININSLFFINIITYKNKIYL